MTWWQRFLNWLGLSEPGGRKEQVEDWLANNQTVLQSYVTRQNDRKAAKGHFFQRLAGWARPDDNDDDPVNDFAGKIPAWADVTVDVWEAPGGVQGWVLRIWVTETDNTVWTLKYDSVVGFLGWEQVS